MINQTIYDLVQYAISKKLIEKSDEIYGINQLLDIFNLDIFDIEKVNTSNCETNLENLLENSLNYALDNGLISQNDIVLKDLFDTKIMGVFAKMPSEIERDFYSHYNISPINATDSFYQYCKNINYIRDYRIKKDLQWKYNCEYGDIDITINLSKPEKDPKMIAALKNMPQSNYPKCPICAENVGYFGRLNHTARQNLRVIPLELAGEKWSFQYSPYVYYNEHCIVLENEHKPMKISSKTFELLLDFVEKFPHYFVGSNADLPIVGGSILTHNHFQGGRYQFPMEKAEIEKAITIKKYEDVDVGIVKWPMSVIRIKSKNPDRLIALSEHIFNIWRDYSDSSVEIISSTNGEQHNTITPIARKNNDIFELDLVLRNNRTTAERPYGIFHPNEKLHHIKKENIGLIEVMGLAVLPSRLKNEIEEIKFCILNQTTISSTDNIFKHKEWIEEILQQYSDINSENIDIILQNEIGTVFVKVLEDAGVFKRNQKGITAFNRFLATL
ncbi:MAG: UDP-glucose--hexose-1-phosphate uridylyltransferase [Oscillospiraceae bacterium]